MPDLLLCSQDAANNAGDSDEEDEDDQVILDEVDEGLVSDDDGEDDAFDLSKGPKAKIAQAGHSEVDETRGYAPPHTAATAIYSL